jgi:hypothetical protein
VEHFPGVGFASTTLKSGLFGRLSTSPSGQSLHHSQLLVTQMLSLEICIFIPTVISVLLSPLFFLVTTFPPQPLLSISTYYRMTSLTHSTSIFHPIPITVRNAHLAESQAELCASNVATYLSLSPSSSKGMLKYPQGIFGVPEVPLLACVSLGRSDPRLTIHQIQSKIDF